jgi:hypothetical protein
LAELVDAYYPQELFAELYDEKFHSEEKIFREFNMGAASVLEMWLDESTSWAEIVEEHATKNFSAGDCMMVLFRCATLLQSCVRLAESHPDIAEEASRLRNIILREPLDARNRMLMEDDEAETKEVEAKEDEAEADEPEKDMVEDIEA